jgi:hypothetical protein
MFLLFGSGSKYDKKAGGKTLTKICPNCKTSRTFYQVEKSVYLHVFFIPVLKDKVKSEDSELFKCSKCGSVYSFLGINMQTVFNSFKEKSGFNKMREKMKGNRKQKEEKRKKKRINKELERIKKKIKET